MNNANVEKALKTWLTPLVSGAPVFTGMDSAELPTDARAVIAAVPSIARPVPALGLAEVVLVVATPYFITGGLDAHRALVALVEDAVASADSTGDASLAAALAADASLVFGGTCPRATENDSEGNRWLTSVPFALGLRLA